jgi:hypothetical protein
MFLTLCPGDHEQGEHAPASASQLLPVPVLCTPVLGPSGPMGSLAAQLGPEGTPVCVKGEGRDTGWQGEVVRQVLEYVCTPALQP